MRCSAWRDIAENVAESLTKGARVIVQGRLQQRSYTDKEGNQRISIELQVDEIGPSLRYATAKPVRAARNAQQQPQQGWGQNDAWGNPSSEPAPF